MMAHNDDVNAVCFLDDSPNLIASGSDDHLIKVSGFAGCIKLQRSEEALLWRIQQSGQLCLH